MSISVIIPTLNEAAHIHAALASLRRQQPLEILVVDGGSTDATLTLAAADQVLISPPGRARQMNAGAAHARGDTLLFMHADCLLEDGALPALTRCLQNPRVVAGCFSMRVDGSGWGFRCIDWCASVRVRLTGVVYGDQGLFVRRRVFAELGGFPAVPFLEDVLFTRQLRRRGQVMVLPQRIVTSARRYRKNGLLGQTLRNWTLTALALGGASPDGLARFYPNVR